MVDYALQRRALLADLASGRVGTGGACDAGPYLLRAARFHGEPTDQTCPVCRRDQLTNVSWIFGASLRHASGSARKPAELDDLAERYDDFSVYVVEVCRTCSWNHLVLSYVLGTGSPDATRSRRTDRRRATAAE